MPNQGRITAWKDDRGFGFITPDDSGRDLFVHIRAFKDRGRRPAVGDRVQYTLGTDADGRPCGLDVSFVGHRSPFAAFTAGKVGPLVVAATVLAFAAVAFALGLGNRYAAILGVYLGASVIAFIAYYIDKKAAKNDRRRIPEKTLHMLGLIGGWPGAFIAQRLFHHKSRKLSFQVTFWATVILNCLALGSLFTDSGTQMLNSFLNHR